MVYLHNKAQNVRATTKRSRIVQITASTAYLNFNDHDDKTVVVDAAAGCAIRLPAANGSGMRVSILIGTTITSNSTTIKVANATDILVGNAIQSQDSGATLQMFETAADSDTISFNGSSTGGIKGDLVQLQDIRAGFWSVLVIAAGTGSEATCFSATVS